MEGGETSSVRPRPGSAEEAPSARSRQARPRPDQSGFDDILPFVESEETLDASGRRVWLSSEDEDPHGGFYRRRRLTALETVSSGPSRPSGCRLWADSGSGQIPRRLRFARRGLHRFARETVFFFCRIRFFFLQNR